jgi:hypothetical protein
MSIQPFLSATKDDLDADCRPEAIRAVRLAGSEPVTMETWDTEYEDPVKVCREKIEQSSHYIGIFAFRRGWTPPVLHPNSITEAEFDWAVKFEKPMVVFLPNPVAPFTRVLEARASGQADLESQAQKMFLKRVMQKTVQLFETPSDLTTRIALRVERWSNGFPAAAPQPEQPPVRRTPDEVEVSKLGRTEQERDFEDALNFILRPGWARTACFLISGPSLSGHSRLAARLRKKLEARPGVKQYSVTLGPLWRKATTGRLVEVIGSGIERDWVPNSVAALAERLGRMLKEGDVVLEVANVHHLDGSLSAFAENFWQPLANALGAGSPYRLAVLATVEQTTPAEWEAYLQPPLRRDAVAFDPLRLIKLPELQAFEEEELSTWLQNGGWLKPDDAQAFAQALIAQTGGVPEILYLKLTDDSTWAV